MTIVWTSAAVSLSSRHNALKRTLACPRCIDATACPSASPLRRRDGAARVARCGSPPARPALPSAGVAASSASAGTIGRRYVSASCAAEPGEHGTAPAGRSCERSAPRRRGEETRPLRAHSRMARLSVHCRSPSGYVIICVRRPAGRNVRGCRNGCGLSHATVPRTRRALRDSRPESSRPPTAWPSLRGCVHRRSRQNRRHATVADGVICSSTFRSTGRCGPMAGASTHFGPLFVAAVNIVFRRKMSCSAWPGFLTTRSHALLQSL